MSCKLGDKCDNVFACNILRPNVELLGCNFYKPKKPMTNEEWFCGLSTTEKSEFLSTMVKEAIEVHEKHGITWHETVSWWDGWLKEIHNEQA